MLTLDLVFGIVLSRKKNDRKSGGGKAMENKEFKSTEVKDGFTVQVGDMAGFIKGTVQIFVGKVTAIYLGEDQVIYVKITSGRFTFTKKASVVYSVYA